MSVDIATVIQPCLAEFLFIKFAVKSSEVPSNRSKCLFSNSVWTLNSCEDIHCHMKTIEQWNVDFRLITSPITVSLSLPVQSMSSISEIWWHLLRDESLWRPTAVWGEEELDESEEGRRRKRFMINSVWEKNRWWGACGGKALVQRREKTNDIKSIEMCAAETRVQSQWGGADRWSGNRIGGHISMKPLFSLSFKCQAIHWLSLRVFLNAVLLYSALCFLLWCNSFSLHIWIRVCGSMEWCSFFCPMY